MKFKTTRSSWALPAEESIAARSTSLATRVVCDLMGSGKPIGAICIVRSMEGWHTHCCIVMKESGHGPAEIVRHRHYCTMLMVTCAPAPMILPRSYRWRAAIRPYQRRCNGERGSADIARPRHRALSVRQRLGKPVTLTVAFRCLTSTLGCGQRRASLDRSGQFRRFSNQD